MAGEAKEANDDAGGDDVGHDVLGRDSSSPCGGSNTVDIPSAEAAEQSDPSSHLTYLITSSNTMR